MPERIVFLTLQQVAEMFQINPEVARRHACKGLLRGARKIGRNWRFHPVEVLESYREHEERVDDFTPPSPKPVRRQPPELDQLTHDAEMAELDRQIAKMGATG